jgi:hypothetical protein
MKFNILLFMALLCATTMKAQRVQIIGGINYASISMGKPTTYRGSTVEKYGHIGGSQIGLRLEIGREETDTGIFSLSFETLMAQIGTNYSYNGQGDRIWRTVEGIDEVLISKGTMETRLEISNTYLKLPILLNININDHFSLQLGGYAAYLIRSRGTGTLQYFNGVIESYPPDKIKGFKTTLNYNYLDEYDDGAVVGKDTLCLTNLDLGMRPTSLGAYYDRNGRKGVMFNRLDLGLNAGVTLQAGGWLVMARVSYGLSDVFNNDYHAREGVIENKKFVLNNDFQRNISYELSIGFRL